MTAKQRWLMFGIILQCDICMLLGMTIQRTRFEDNGQKFGIKESNISKYFTMMLAFNNVNISVLPTITLDAKETEYKTIDQEVYTLQKSEGDTFEVVGGNEWIDVNASTGSIRVKKPFDYETLSQAKTIDCTLRIRNPLLHTDDLQRVIIRCTDVNDEVPYFVNRPLPMQTIVPLRAPEGTVVYKLEARDLDTNHEIHYILVKDQSNGRFTVDEQSGEVRTRGTDYFGQDEEYIIIVKAEDRNGQRPQFTAEESLSIMGGRRPPQFSEPYYTVSIPENKQIGMEVISVKAKSFADKDITYTMTSEAITEATFSIPNPTNGIVKLTKELDYEDIRQQKSYRITLTATESGGASNTAMLMVNIEDVNDEAPKFNLPEYQAWINEDVKTQTSILTASSTATVHIMDENDSPPKFTKPTYQISVEETEGENIAESPILTVSVFDNDTSAVNTFVYSVVQGNFGSDFFAMSTNPDGTGSLKIAKTLDYEDPKQRDGFKLNISVTDRLDDNGPKDYATVEVTLVGRNDNTFLFDLPHILASVLENAVVGTPLKAFHATEVGNHGESKVFYHISSESDPKDQFAVNELTGIVTIRRPLDRETIPRHEVIVLAINDDVPPKTATGTLTVFLRDVNDNYPTFYEDYHPVVLEHTPPAFVIEIRARDPDDSSMGHGSPFIFYLPPDEDNPTKDDFTIDYDPSGFNNEGSIKIISLHEFDREKQKFYYMPIIIQDSGTTTPMSGTSTLTIEIGDVNDKEPFNGRKEIFVFRCKGKLPETPIGHVSIEDPDDNDLEDKEFTWKTPPAPPKYFLLDKDSGMLSMKANTPIKRKPYILQVNVYDKKYKTTVTKIVTVYVKETNEVLIS